MLILLILAVPIMICLLLHAAGTPTERKNKYGDCE